MTPNLTEVEAFIVDLTNTFRFSIRLDALRRDTNLDRAARAYAQVLAASGKFSHSADGKSFSDRMTAAGYGHCLGAENLSLNSDSRGFTARQLARDAVEGWKKSPGHRKNLEAALAVDIGVGVAKSPSAQTYYSVQLFGRPDELRQKFRIENLAGLAIIYTLEGERKKLDAQTIVTHSTCKPSEIVLQPDDGYALAPPSTSRYVSQDGDTFVITRSPNGLISLRHVPRTE